MENEKVIYLDNGDTTRIDDSVLEYMMKYYKESYGNPVSLHVLGIEADEALDEARGILSRAINSSTDELYFTSGATESNNMALNGIAKFYQNKGKHVLISAIEHSSVREVAIRLKKEGFDVEAIKVNEEGFIDFDDFEKKLRKDTVLVSVIYGNYEIGTIQDIKRIGEMCHSNGTFFHTDAAQVFGKQKIDVKDENIDLMTFNAHKNHGPKGIGALYIRKGISLTKLMDGGSHERGVRPGTENLPAIMGFAKSAEIAYENLDKINAYLREMRDRLTKGLLEIKHVTYNGPKGDTLNQRLPHNADITFQYIEGEAILMHLTLRNICVSSGSACSSKTLEPSHVLTAIGLKHEQAHGSIRFTVSKYTTKEDIDKAVTNVKEVVSILRNMSSFVPEENSELGNANANAKVYYKERKSEL